MCPNLSFHPSLLSYGNAKRSMQESFSWRKKLLFGVGRRTRGAYQKSGSCVRRTHWERRLRLMWNVNFRSRSDAFSLALSPARKWSVRRCGGTSTVAAVNLFCCKTTTDDGICSLSLFSFCEFVWWCPAPRERWVRDAALFSDFASRAQLNFALPQRRWISGECRWQFFLLPLFFLWETSFFKRGGIGDLRWERLRFWLFNSPKRLLQW